MIAEDVERLLHTALKSLRRQCLLMQQINSVTVADGQCTIWLQPPPVGDAIRRTARLRDRCQHAAYNADTWVFRISKDVSVYWIEHVRRAPRTRSKRP